MRTSKLNKTNVKDLNNKKPDICYLLENDLTNINSCMNYLKHLKMSVV